MPGLPAIATLAFAYLAAVVEPHAGVVAETMAGEAPLVQGEAPRSGVAGIVTPSVEVDVRSPGSELRLDYGPRFFWRHPNQAARTSRTRPLLLHQTSLVLSLKASRTVTVDARAALSIGEADYSILPRLFNPGQGALPEVLRLASGVAGVNTLWQATERLELQLAMEASHLRPLDTTEDGPTFPRQTLLGATPGAALRLTRLDDAIVRTGVNYATYSSGIELFTLLPEIGWARRLGPRVDLRVLGGLAYTWNRGIELATGWHGPLSPIGTFELDGRLMRDGGRAMRVTVGGTVEYFVDPVLAAAGPRGRAWGRFSVLFRPRWVLGLDALFATSLRSDPLPSNPYETVASVSLPLRHFISPWVTIEVGGRWSNRAAHFDAPNFAFNQRELWIYGMVTVSTHRASDAGILGTVVRVGTARSRLPQNDNRRLQELDRRNYMPAPPPPSMRPIGTPPPADGAPPAPTSASTSTSASDKDAASAVEPVGPERRGP